MNSPQGLARCLLALASALLCSPLAAAPGPIPFRIEAVYPHDPAAFTQGLVYYQGKLYESTGLRGRSQLRIVDPVSGQVLARKRLPARYFGEGLARVDQRLYQLTWTAGEGFIHDLRGLSPAGRFRFTGEGWGLAFDGRLLWKSDGSHYLRKHAPFGFRGVGEPLVVHLNGSPVPRLNELEFVDGMLFANVWQTDRILRINPHSGQVTGWLELGGLLSAAERARADVLNGIAWDPEARRMLVTGKLWPKLFVLSLVNEDEP